jgi:hypothetical protein
LTIGRKVGTVLCLLTALLLPITFLDPALAKDTEIGGLASPDYVAPGWKIELIDHMGDVGAAPSISTDQSNRPHITYWNRTGENLKYAYYSDGSWKVTTMDEGYRAGPPFASVHDSLDRLHVIYNKAGDLMYAINENGTWTIQMLPGYGTGCGPNSIAVDSRGFPHILACAYSGPVDLYHLYWNGSIWVAELIEDRFFAALASIFIESNDHMHVAYMDLDNWTMMYARKEGDSWRKEEVGDAWESYTSLVVDSKGEPYVTYRESIDHANSDNFAYKLNSRWVSEEFAFPCIWGSLAINSTDGIHLVYRHNNQLGYAYKNESGWQTLIVDSRNFNAHNPSIALDTESIPHLAYYDYSNKNLVYATKSESEMLATVDIDPDTLNLGSRGRFVTAYIELEDADVRDIDASTIRLNDVVSPVLDERYGFVTSEESYIIDHDNDGIMERMVKFWRPEVQQILDLGLSVTIVVTGQLFDWTSFKGTDAIRAINPESLTKPMISMMSNEKALGVSAEIVESEIALGSAPHLNHCVACGGEGPEHWFLPSSFAELVFLMAPRTDESPELCCGTLTFYPKRH